MGIGVTHCHTGWPALLTAFVLGCSNTSSTSSAGPSQTDSSANGGTAGLTQPVSATAGVGGRSDGKPVATNAAGKTAGSAGIPATATAGAPPEPDAPTKPSTPAAGAPAAVGGNAAAAAGMGGALAGAGTGGAA